MTWAGQQGFQTPIQNDSFIVDGVGALGVVHQERGLTYYEVELSGHMVPQYSPVVSCTVSYDNVFMADLLLGCIPNHELLAWPKIDALKKSYPSFSRQY